jgi:hypothetical protein
MRDPGAALHHEEPLPIRRAIKRSSRIISAAPSGVGAMNERCSPAKIKRTTEPRWAAMRPPLRIAEAVAV